MKPKLICALASIALLSAVAGTQALAAPPIEQNNGREGTGPYDQGLEVSYCPSGRRKYVAPVTPPPVPYAEGQLAYPTPEAQTTPEAQPTPSLPTAHAASTSEAGWPAKQCLKMDKGPAGRKHTIVGLNGAHNWLLGGYGNDTIIGGNKGDVIWGDYHPNGEPASQTVTIHAGNGRNVIYANDTHNYVWTGTNPYTVVHAHVSGISGVIHCQSPYIVVYLSTVSERAFKLDGCHRISHSSVGY